MTKRMTYKQAMRQLKKLRRTGDGTYRMVYCDEAGEYIAQEKDGAEWLCLHDGTHKTGPRPKKINTFKCITCDEIFEKRYLEKGSDGICKYCGEAEQEDKRGRTL